MGHCWNTSNRVPLIRFEGTDIGGLCQMTMIYFEGHIIFYRFNNLLLTYSEYVATLFKFFKYRSTLYTVCFLKGIHCSIGLKWMGGKKKKLGIKFHIFNNFKEILYYQIIWIYTFFTLDVVENAYIKDMTYYWGKKKKKKFKRFFFHLKKMIFFY